MTTFITLTLARLFAETEIKQQEEMLTQKDIDQKSSDWYRESQSKNAAFARLLKGEMK